MFLGEYEHSTDDKHRVVLPLALRRGIAKEDISRGLVLAPDEETECLELYSMPEWDRHIADLETTLDVHRDKKAREFFRDYTGRAALVNCDGQSRFLIPDSLRERVGIEREVHFVGMVRFVEIWAAERWRQREALKEGGA